MNADGSSQEQVASAQLIRRRGYTGAQLLWIAGALAMTILGARWALIDRWGMSMPYMDQWDAEGRAILAPWFRHDHNLGNLFVPQNEHRVALTRACALLLTLANRQWDQRLEAVCNALLPAALAAGLICFVGGRLGRPATAALAGLLAIVYCVPFAWENTIHGFHSQQFFLIDFAVLSLATVPLCRPLRTWWWIGVLGLGLSLGSMATGFFAALACAATVIFRILRSESHFSNVWPSLAACTLATAVGILSRHIVPLDAPLMSHSLREFWAATIQALAWPGFAVPWGYFALVLWAPWAAVVARIARGRLNDNRFGYFIAGSGLWVLMQILATAYARGAHGNPPSSRYLDTIIVGLATNAFALALLVNEVSNRRVKMLTLAWSLVLLTGFVDQVLTVLPGQTADLKRENYYQESNVRNYLATGDSAYLRHSELPYPNWETLKQKCLDDPQLRALLPASVRVPIALPEAASRGFVTDDTRRPESAPMPRAVPNDGLPLSTPPLRNARFRGSYTSGGSFADGRSWRSLAVTSAIGGWLQFLVAGDLGRPGLSLQLCAAATGTVLAEIVPAHVPGSSWHSAFVRTPKSAFYVQASDHAKDGWFAFSDPIEMGALSYLSWRATRNGEWIAWVGALFLITALVGPTLPTRRV